MKTLKLRIKDKHKDQLQHLATSVNFVWNYVNDLSYKYLQRHHVFLSAYDLAEYTKGGNVDLNLHSQTVQAVVETYVKCRKQFKKAKLAWRVSNQSKAKRSLGWIPFKNSAIRLVAVNQTGKKARKATLQFSLAGGNKLKIDVWDSYNLSLYEINTCELVQDAYGHWYACITVRTPDDKKVSPHKKAKQPKLSDEQKAIIKAQKAALAKQKADEIKAQVSAYKQQLLSDGITKNDLPKLSQYLPSPLGKVVGVDLGIKTGATTSDGACYHAGFTKQNAVALAIAQRAGKTQRVRAIHRKIKNQRKDAQHKFTKALVDDYDTIIVGDISLDFLIKPKKNKTKPNQETSNSQTQPKKRIKTAKASYDNGLGELQRMLEYKCQQAGKRFVRVKESMTTQVCSCCGHTDCNSPKGRGNLGVREWTCSTCHTTHDRDINAAKNILAVGLHRLAVGIPLL